MVCLFCLISVSSFAQIERHGNNVWVPIDVYNGYRNQIIQFEDTIIPQCDSIKLECDSIILAQDRRLLTKDSIIANRNGILALKDTIIKNKNETIRLLSIVPAKPKVSKAFLKGLVAGVLTEAYIISAFILFKSNP